MNKFNTPWIVEERVHSFDIVDHPNKFHVALVSIQGQTKVRVEYCRSVARLIAASPSLLSACNQAYNILDDIGNGRINICERPEDLEELVMVMDNLENAIVSAEGCNGDIS